MTEPKHPDLLPQVSTAAVQVRWLELDPVTPQQVHEFALLLDDAERARAARFHFQRDRDAYIAAHALVRTLLSAAAPRPPTDWRFAMNDHSKPEVLREAGAPPLRFNLSHTQGLVAVALTLEHDVGIDVEALEPERLDLDLAERTFAPAEVALARATPAAELTATLFAIWTLKEAYVKAVGRGLSVPLEDFALSLDPLAIHFSSSLGEDPAHWLVHRIAPTQTHALALALRHPDPASVAVDACGVNASDVLASANQVSSGGGQMGRK